MDEPLADPAAVALYFVAELASKDVKVVLSGEGADELFGGYNTYRKDVDYSLYNKIPFFIRHFIASVCKLLPEVRGINFLIRRGQKLEESYIGVNKVFSERDKKKIINFKYENHSNKDLTKWVYDSLSNQDDIIKMQAIDINFWLIKDILQKADKMTMAHSIEGRVPFTDIEVFNLARTLPDYAKVTKENTKVALRMAAKEVIPNESYNKKKLGFPVPLREWLRDDDAYDLVKKSFDSEISIELFNHKRIMKLLDEHHTGKKDNYKKIWALYCFIVWYHEFFA
jgi:asparagine synthase (glutamine-hydrolysing)